MKKNEEEYRIQAIEVPFELQRRRFTKICTIIQLKANADYSISIVPHFEMGFLCCTSLLNISFYLSIFVFNFYLFPNNLFTIIFTIPNAPKFQKKKIKKIKNMGALPTVFARPPWEFCVFLLLGISNFMLSHLLFVNKLNSTINIFFLSTSAHFNISNLNFE